MSTGFPKQDSWTGTPQISVTVRNLDFCQATFLASRDLLGYILGSVLRVP